MARGTEDRYIRFYTAGSAARQPELPRQLPRKQLPKAEPRQVPERSHSPALLLAGLAVAAVILVCMALCCGKYLATCKQIDTVTRQVEQLEQQQAQLRQEYESKLDLEQVRIAAENMGMVPAEQVRHILIPAPRPQLQEQPGFWQQLWEQIVYFFS